MKEAWDDVWWGKNRVLVLIERVSSKASTFLPLHVLCYTSRPCISITPEFLCDGLDISKQAEHVFLAWKEYRR